MNKLFEALPPLFLIFIVLGASTAGAEISTTFEGRRLYNTYCHLCHGLDGKGNGPLAGKLDMPPADLTDSARISGKTNEELTKVIQDGIGYEGNIKGMPKWGGVISKPDIQALVSYIRFLGRSRHPLAGDPEIGKGIYQKYCAVCHGQDGKGNGIMAGLLRIKPVDHTDPDKMDKLNNQDLIRIIYLGKEEGFMPAWKEILTSTEIQAVVSYIRVLSH